ncbi:uncharacterized protein LOC129620872 isoform X5 [Bubalus kerabau]|uniref:uncharacterized protein LOC129620872 isoform X5 n=1 Tax=Bubalus carabanensis TaxID=3119969 RepID=UPI00244E829F|nr:uncharacterized protein LOC129620872 isoform X5 [Bubalus carabanensis]
MAGLVVSGTQVSYIGQDCREIPEHLGRDCGHFAKRLDLSFNLLRKLLERKRERTSRHTSDIMWVCFITTAVKRVIGHFYFPNGAGEVSSESLGQQGDQTSQS